MRLRGAEDSLAADLGHRLGDQQPSPHEVDAFDLERGEFTPPQSGVGEHPDDQAVRSRCVGEIGDLGVRQEDLLGFADAGKSDSRSHVAGKPAIPDRDGEQEREDAVSLPNG
jgi:hypothetical protein